MATVFHTATSLDGFLADEHDSLHWLLSQPLDDDGPYDHGAFMTGVGAMLMGATTYRWLLDELARTAAPWPYEVPCWVLAHRAFPTPPATVRLVAGDVGPVLDAALEAAAGRDVWIVGGGGLATDVALAGRLDRIVVSIAPVSLGAGRPLLTAPLDLRLLGHARNGAFLCAEYEVIGPSSAG